MTVCTSRARRTKQVQPQTESELHGRRAPSARQRRHQRSHHALPVEPRAAAEGCAEDVPPDMEGLDFHMGIRRLCMAQA